LELKVESEIWTELDLNENMLGCAEDGFAKTELLEMFDWELMVKLPPVCSKIITWPALRA
jgi:hypothetical protein